MLLLLLLCCWRYQADICLIGTMPAAWSEGTCREYASPAESVPRGLSSSTPSLNHFHAMLRIFLLS